MAPIIRIPKEEEARDCAQLLYISGPEMYNYIFVSSPPEVQDFIKELFVQGGTMFSRDHALIEEDEGRVRGLIQGFDASEMKMKFGQILKYLKGFLSVVGFVRLCQMLLRLKMNSYFPKVEEDEFYVSNLAVFKEFRGRGISVALMKRIEELAREKGLKKLSLYVETDLSRAISVYQKFGFKEVGKSQFPIKYRKYNLRDYYKMVKDLEI